MTEPEHEVFDYYYEMGIYPCGHCMCCGCDCDLHETDERDTPEVVKPNL